MSTPKTKRLRGDRHQNEGAAGKYYHQMLNMADDDLGPFEYRLLGHYIRVCGAEDGGVCYQTVRTIAEITKMSIPKVIAARNELAKNGWIRIEARANKSHNVTVVDRMAENVRRYSVQNVERESVEDARDQNIDHGDQDIDRGDQYPANKEEPNKKNQKEEPEKEHAAALAAAPQPDKVQPPPAPVQPHVAVIDAYRDALREMGREPLEDNWYARFGRAAKKFVKLEVSPERVRAATLAVYSDGFTDNFYKRRANPITLEELAGVFAAAEAATPPPPIHIDYGDETLESMWARRREDHFRRLAAGEFDKYLTDEERAARDAQNLVEDQAA